MYDIFFVSEHDGNVELWNKCKSRFPNSQKIQNCNNINQISQHALTKMFWVIWDDLCVNETFDLTEYRATKWDDMYVHIFQNGNNFDGICLFPKKLKISQREFDNRFFTEKKEINIMASMPLQQFYDIVFISFDEPNADDNFNRLLDKFPRAKRIHGVVGIHQAHLEAAKLATTSMFYVVDGDAVILDNFNFDYLVPRYERNHVHVWRSRNPVNNLEYGYGGVKLLPREKVLAMSIDSADMTTSISNNLKVMNDISNITAFNTDPFNSWKSAFRECVKLASRIIDRQTENETQTRLTQWCTVGDDINAIEGAIAGREFGIKNKNNKTELKKINDFNWLREQFDGR
jgi:hypothetical protein